MPPWPSSSLARGKSEWLCRCSRNSISRFAHFPSLLSVLFPILANTCSEAGAGLGLGYLLTPPLEAEEKLPPRLVEST